MTWPFTNRRIPSRCLPYCLKEQQSQRRALKILKISQTSMRKDRPSGNLSEECHTSVRHSGDERDHPKTPVVPLLSGADREGSSCLGVFKHMCRLGSDGALWLSTWDFWLDRSFRMIMQCIVCFCFCYHFLLIGPLFLHKWCTPRHEMPDVTVHKCPQLSTRPCRTRLQSSGPFKWQKRRFDGDWMNILSIAFKADQSDVFPVSWAT